MQTKLLGFSESDLTLAGKLIRDGQLVAFPTETVYGLGANALDVAAVKSTYVAKGRPSDNPLIVHVWHASQIYEIASYVSPVAQKVIECLMPGSVTIVLPKKPLVDDCITAGLPTVAIRMPKSQQARDFLRYCDVPVTAPSANTSSRPSPTTWQRVQEDMDGKIAAILCGDNCQVGIESTVLDLTDEQPRILRPGVVTADMLEAVLGCRVETITDPTSKVNSPGVRYKHYAPCVPMVLDRSGDVDKLCAYYDKLVAEGHNPVLLCEHPERFDGRNTRDIGATDDEVAQNLFENLRLLERKYDFIVASYTSQTEYAQSILNRLIRSCGHKII